MNILFVSPHLDDVAFSCGGTIAKYVAEGDNIIICTVFTKSITPEGEFAISCQTNKNIPQNIDYLLLRRKEDESFAKIIGAKKFWLDFPEAPYRGYSSSIKMFSGIQSTDNDIFFAIYSRIINLINQNPFEQYYFPAAIGGHVDHLIIKNIAINLLENNLITNTLYFYEDLPYAIRGHKADDFFNKYTKKYVDIEQYIKVKLSGILAYKSQIEFQFGTKEKMYKDITEYAHKVALQIGQNGWYESFWKAN
jgi:LmbE family N-acetylglucosaminyl deacetylase